MYKCVLNYPKLI